MLKIHTQEWIRNKSCNEWKTQKRHECTNIKQLGRTQIMMALGRFRFRSFKISDRLFFFFWTKCTLQVLSSFLIAIFVTITIPNLRVLLWTSPQAIKTSWEPEDPFPECNKTEKESNSVNNCTFHTQYFSSKTALRSTQPLNDGRDYCYLPRL
jgi:hypothetical protein